MTHPQRITAYAPKICSCCNAHCCTTRSLLDIVLQDKRRPRLYESELLTAGNNVSADMKAWIKMYPSPLEFVALHLADFVRPFTYPAPRAASAQQQPLQQQQQQHAYQQPQRRRGSGNGGAATPTLPAPSNQQSGHFEPGAAVPDSNRSVHVDACSAQPGATPGVVCLELQPNGLKLAYATAMGMKMPHGARYDPMQCEEFDERAPGERHGFVDNCIFCSYTVSCNVLDSFLSDGRLHRAHAWLEITASASKERAAYMRLHCTRSIGSIRCSKPWAGPCCCLEPRLRTDVVVPACSITRTNVMCIMQRTPTPFAPCHMCTAL